MADSKPPSGPLRPPSGPTSGPMKRSGEKEFLRDLKSFRKEALHVTQEDETRWKEEARRREPDEPELPSEPAPPPPPRKRSFKYRRQVAAGVLVLCVVIGFLQIDFSRPPAPTASPSPSPVATPSSIRSPSFRTVVPEPKRTPIVREPVMAPAFALARAYLVCRYETTLLRRGPHPRPADATRPVSPSARDAQLEFDGDGEEGPAEVFDDGEELDALDRYRSLVPGGGRISRSSLAQQLGEFQRRSANADERYVASSLTDDASTTVDAGERLLAHPQEGRFEWAVALAAGLGHAATAPARARALLVRALEGAPPDDPWPARALALFDTRRGRPGDSIGPLTEFFARSQGNALAGFQLARLQVDADRLPEALTIVDSLAKRPDPDAARVLGVWLALATGDVARASAYLAPLEAGLATKTRPEASRILALKARTALVRRPSDPAAQTILEEAIAKDRSCSWSYLYLGRFLVGQNRFEEAMPHYLSYLRLRPGRIAVHREFAELCTRVRARALALGEYRWLLVHAGPERGWAEGLLQAANELNLVDLLRHESARR